MDPEHFFFQIQVDTYAQMHTRVELLGGCRCWPYWNYLGGYSQIIGEDTSTQSFGTPDCSSSVYHYTTYKLLCSRPIWVVWVHYGCQQRWLANSETRSELRSRFGSLIPARFSTKRVDQIVVY